jgi:hypothetical protein
MVARESTRVQTRPLDVTAHRLAAGIQGFRSSAAAKHRLADMKITLIAAKRCMRHPP